MGVLVHVLQSQDCISLTGRFSLNLYLSTMENISRMNKQCQHLGITVYMKCKIICLIINLTENLNIDFMITYLQIYVLFQLDGEILQTWVTLFICYVKNFNKKNR